jgi:hypothetical protein
MSEKTTTIPYWTVEGGFYKVVLRGTPIVARLDLDQDGD